MLTAKQSKLFHYLSETLKETKVSPSYEEMKIALGLNSKSGIHRLINALEERGFIKRLHNKARAIRIIKNQNEENTNNAFKLVNHSNYKIHIYGKIAAGTPIEAIQHSEGFLSIPENMIKNNNQHYALKVSGLSIAYISKK